MKSFVSHPTFWAGRAHLMQAHRLLQALLTNSEHNNSIQEEVPAQEVAKIRTLIQKDLDTY